MHGFTKPLSLCHEIFLVFFFNLQDPRNLLLVFELTRVIISNFSIGKYFLCGNNNWHKLFIDILISAFFVYCSF